MDSEKVFFSIREAEQMTGLPASTLRYWEKQFDGLRPRKDGHGNRYYTKKHIDLIKQIRFIRDEQHITRIEAIRQQLKPEKNIDVREKTTDILQQMRKELLALRQMITDTDSK